MKYKVGDKIRFIKEDSLMSGEILQTKGLLFKRYRVAYNTRCFNNRATWIRPRDIICVKKVN